MRAVIVAVLLAGTVVATPPQSADAASARACAHAPRAPFVDVSRRNVHAAMIDCLYWYRVTRGTGVDTYEPGGSVSRAQMASFMARLVRSAGVKLPPPGDAFDDVDDSIHRRDIEQLAAAGIVHGVGDRRFAPLRDVPRGQMTAFLVRTWRYVTGLPPPAGTDAFEDDDGHRFEANINSAHALGLAHGTGDGDFDPDGLTTRAQMASFIVRLLKDLASRGHVPIRRGGFSGSVEALPGSLRRLMSGSSWRQGCPVRLDDLRLIEATHWTFAGERAWGLLVVHEQVARDSRWVLRQLYAAGFPIAQMRLVDRYGADDDRSMAANNSSAFNCRTVSGTSTWSQHAYGLAVDINPIQNPYVSGRTVEPPAGTAYLDRSHVRPGMVVRPGPVVDAFEAIGWGWGGDWSSVKDYQHFSRNGR